MKKRLTALLLIGLLVFGASGCRSKIKTELPVKNIRSMICTDMGDIFFLSDNGLIRYNLSSDKKVETIYTTSELSEAEFEWVDNGTELIYSGLYIDRLMPAGDEGVTMVGKYMHNTLGRDAELFVFQDAADLNFSAGFFTEIEKIDGAFVNGVGADSKAIYFKLNANGTNGIEYKEGSRFSYMGMSRAYYMPDGVTGAILKDEDSAVLLVETDDKIALVDGETTIKEFDRAAIADAFVSDDGVYAVYKNGTVTRTDISGTEEDFLTLAGKVSKVNDALLYDGNLYWFDKDGIKTSAK